MNKDQRGGSRQHRILWHKQACISHLAAVIAAYWVVDNYAIGESETEPGSIHAFYLNYEHPNNGNSGKR